MRLEDRITRLERLMLAFFDAGVVPVAEEDSSGILFNIETIRMELEHLDCDMFGEDSHDAR